MDVGGEDATTAAHVDEQGLGRGAGGDDLGPGPGQPVKGGELAFLLPPFVDQVVVLA
jgi:hypothetical protein